MQKKSNRLEREFRYCLRRCGKLTHCEHRLLSFVASYEYGCLLTYEEMVPMLAMSERTIERTVASLKKLGLIEVEYRIYKKTKLQIVEASIQAKFSITATHGGTVNRQPSTHEPPPVSAITATHGGTNTERELERELESVSFSGKQKEGKEGWGNVATINSILANSRFGKKN